MKKILFLATMIVALTTGTANASGTRVLSGDTLQNTSGGAAIAVPSTGANIVTDTASQTLTNKTLTTPAISSPTGLVKADVGLSNVDNTSDASKNSASVTLTNKTISGASNTLSAIPAGTALTGQVPVANGGTGLGTLTTGNLLVGAGTGNVTFIAPGSNGNVLTSNGSVWSSAAPAGAAPNVSGSQASPIAITAAGGVTFSGSGYFNTSYVTGSPGAVTVSATPQVAAGSLVGQRLRLIGTSATNTITLADGTGLSLNGPIVLGNNSAIDLDWNGSVWTETSRR